MEFFGKPRLRPLQDPTITHKGHDDGTHHHKGEARIPGSRSNPGEIEKVEDFCWIGHAGQQESETKDQTDRKLENNGHSVHPRCRATKTVAMPVAMKVTVATRERIESRDNPHTPWPEGQPLPHTEPNPTRNPARTTMAPLAWMVCAGSLPVATSTTSGAATNPATKARRPANSLSA